MNNDEVNDHNHLHLAPLTDKDWPADLADMLGGFAGGLNVYRTMAYHPALLRAWSDLREHVVLRSTLGEQNLEVVILRTGHRLNSEYEWLQHVSRARLAGLSDARIGSIRGPVGEMENNDGLLCTAVDELFDTSKLRQNTLSQLNTVLGKEAIFDLMATVGFYSTLGFIVNSFNTPLDDDIRARLKANPLKS